MVFELIIYLQVFVKLLSRQVRAKHLVSSLKENGRFYDFFMISSSCLDNMYL